jgi:predicted dehydrogenase
VAFHRQSSRYHTDLGARGVAAPGEVFDADDVDAVLIASPDAVHAEQLEQSRPSRCCVR